MKTQYFICYSCYIANMGLCGLMSVSFLTQESKANELGLLVTIEKGNCKHDMSGTGCSKLPPKVAPTSPKQVVWAHSTPSSQEGSPPS